MKMSPETVAVLKNFATIHPSIIIDPGSTLSIRDRSGTMFAKATVPDTFSHMMAIYDLPQFLNMFGMMQAPTISVDASKNTAIIKDDKVTVKYTFVERILIKEAPTNFQGPPTIVEFELSAHNLQQLLRGGNVMQLPEVRIRGDGANLFIGAIDPDNPSSNSYEIQIGDSKQVFEAYMKMESFKHMPRSYKVSVSSRVVTFQSIDDDAAPVTYWISLLMHSQFE